MIASWTGQESVVVYLVSRGANPTLSVHMEMESPSKERKATAYDYAVHQRHCAIAHVLWENMHRRGESPGRRPRACTKEYHARQQPDEREE